MPLGNGDVGLNVWVDENGDLAFYISKVDAFDAGHYLPKLGRVRLRGTGGRLCSFRIVEAGKQDIVENDCLLGTHSIEPAWKC